MSSYFATAEASPNIALVKYWGKRDEKLFLPTNNSISATMDDSLRTRTTTFFDSSLRADELWLNGERQDSRELTRFLDLVRGLAKTKLKARVASVNCFPTGAGFASSASGYAALAVACNEALKLHLDARGLSILARQGSGSACRSVLGGFVEWQAGKKKDGSDSHAVQLNNEMHWPQLRNVIAVAAKEKKKVSSRSGMQSTVSTSPLFQARLNYLPSALAKVRAAIEAKDLPALCEAIMRDSDNMHACMLDSWPPIMYLNDVSRRVIESVLEFNASEGELAAGYTFDAGPNAHVFTIEKNVPALVKKLEQVDGVKQVLVASVGSGPRVVLKESEFLIDENGVARKAVFNGRKIVFED